MLLQDEAAIVDHKDFRRHCRRLCENLSGSLRKNKIGTTAREWKNLKGIKGTIRFASKNLCEAYRRNLKIEELKSN